MYHKVPYIFMYHRDQACLLYVYLILYVYVNMLILSTHIHILKNLSCPVGVFLRIARVSVTKPTNNVVPTMEHWPGFGMSGHRGWKKGAGIRADGLDGLLLVCCFFHLTLTSKGLIQRPTHESVIPTKINTKNQNSFPYIPPSSWKLAKYYIYIYIYTCAAQWYR